MYVGKMLCYARLVYMPMSYLYGKRFVGRITSLVQTIRDEIYIQPYHQIDWNKARNTCAKVCGKLLYIFFVFFGVTLFGQG